MAGQKPKSSSNNLRNQGKKIDSVESNSDVVPVLSENDWMDLKENDMFQELFSEDYDRVEIYRVEPKYINGVDISGYIDNLNPGSTLRTIKHSYGGGTYKIVRRSESGQFAQQKIIQISGAPRLENAEPAPRPGTSTGGAPEREKTVEIDGIPFTLNSQKFMDELKQVIILKNMFREPEAPRDVNQVLLSHLLNEKNAKNPLETISEIKEAAELLGLGSGSNSGTGVLDIVKEALKTLASLSMSKSLPGAGMSPVKSRFKAGLLPVETRPALTETTGDIGQAENENPPESEVAMAKMDSATMAQIAVVNIVNCYRLKPPKEVKRVVSMLDQLLRMSKEQRSKLVPWKNYLFDMAETQLAEDFLDDDEGKMRETFSEYFNQIFDCFCDLEREVNLI